MLGVGDFHAGEFADHGLELEHGLQGALRDLGLIGRVAGEEFAALDEGIDDDRAIVPIGARAEKAGELLLAGWLASSAASPLAMLPAKARKRSRTSDSECWRGMSRSRVRRNSSGMAGEEVFDGGDADGFEHLGAVGGRFGEIAHGGTFWSLNSVRSGIRLQPAHRDEAAMNGHPEPGLWRA